MSYTIVLSTVVAADLPMPDLVPDSGSINLGGGINKASVAMNGGKPTLVYGRDFTEAMTSFKCSAAATPAAAVWMRALRQLGNSFTVIANGSAGGTIQTYVIKNAQLTNQPELALSSDGKMDFEFTGNSIIVN
jgi:hypothetical protein